MPFSRFLFIPLHISLQAFIMMLIAPFIPFTHPAIGAGLVTWIAFQAWAMYFLAGCTPRMALKTLLGYFGGIVASVAIFELGKAFAGLNTAGTPWGLYLAVFVVVFFVICCEKLPWFDFVPSFFLGAGVFFGLMTHIPQPAGMTPFAWYTAIAIPELIACIAGLAFGWWTVQFRTRYEAWVKARLAPAPVAEETVAR